MIDRVGIRTAAIAVIKAANTSAGHKVYSPMDWPTQDGSYPSIVVRTPHERKENVAPRNGPPTFFSVILLTVVGRVQGMTEAIAQEALDILSGEIESSLLTNGQFIYDNGIQQFVSVETAMEVKTDSGLHYGETVTAFSIEVYQQFDPVIDAAGNALTNDLEGADITITDGPDGVILATQDIDLTGE